MRAVTPLRVDSGVASGAVVVPHERFCGNEAAGGRFGERRREVGLGVRGLDGGRTGEPDARQANGDADERDGAAGGPANARPRQAVQHE